MTQKQVRAQRKVTLELRLINKVVKVLSECLGSRPAWPYLFARTAWCLGLSSSSFVFLFCLSSVLVRTAGCLSPSPSLVLAEALHVGFFFFYFSSLATVIAQIFIRDLISYISYFWRKVRNLVAYENHTRIQVYLTSPSLYENF